MPVKNGTKSKIVYFSPDEWVVVCRKSSAAGMRTGTYIRKISVDGKVEVYDFKEIDDVRLALVRIGTNINQIAKVVNSTSSVYKSDFENMQKQMHEYEQIIENWLSPFNKEIL